MIKTDDLVLVRTLLDGSAATFLDDRAGGRLLTADGCVELLHRAVRAAGAALPVGRTAAGTGTPLVVPRGRTVEAWTVVERRPTGQAARLLTGTGDGETVEHAWVWTARSAGRAIA